MVNLGMEKSQYPFKARYEVKDQSSSIRSKSVDINNLLNRVRDNEKIDKKKKYIFLITAIMLFGLTFFLLF